MAFEFTPQQERVVTDKTEWSRILETPWENLLKLYPHLENRPDFMDLRDWYQNRVEKAGKFILEPSALENFSLEQEEEGEKKNVKGEAWLPTYSTDPETRGMIKEMVRFDRKFLKLVGVKCAATDPRTGETKVWHQPIMQGDEVPFEATIFGEKVEVPVYGILALIKDSEGNILLTTGQEAASENQKHVVVRMPIQASTSKVALTETGDPRGDAGIRELMKAYGCDTMKQLMTLAEEVLMETPSDPDRIFKHNVLMFMPPVPTDSDLHEKLTAGGTRKWLTREQFDMVVVAGLTNSPTEVTVDMSERASRLRKL